MHATLPALASRCALASLPMPVYEPRPTSPSHVYHPCWWLLNEPPEPDVSAAVCWEFLVASRRFYCDCFAEIMQPSFRSSPVSGFRAHHPQRVFPFRASEGSLWYRIQPLVGAEYMLHPADINHVPSMGYDGIRASIRAGSTGPARCRICSSRAIASSRRRHGRAASISTTTAWIWSRAGAGAAADGVAEVAGDDQREIDKPAGLQAYIRALQDWGFVAYGGAK